MVVVLGSSWMLALGKRPKSNCVCFCLFLRLIADGKVLYYLHADVALSLCTTTANDVCD